MAKVQFEGKLYPFVEDPLFGEIGWAERESGVVWEQMPRNTKMAALTLLSLRRGGVAFTWADVQLHLGPANLVEDPEDPQGAPDAGGVAAPVVAPEATPDSFPAGSVETVPTSPSEAFTAPGEGTPEPEPEPTGDHLDATAPA